MSTAHVDDKPFIDKHSLQVSDQVNSSEVHLCGIRIPWAIIPPSKTWILTIQLIHLFHQPAPLRPCNSEVINN